MGIYAHKKGGIPTGLLVVEAEVGGKRLKRYTRDRKEAKRILAQMRAGIFEDGTETYDVECLRRDCQHLWAGTKDEGQSKARLMVVLDHLKVVLGDTPLAEVKTVHIDALVKRLGTVLRPRDKASAKVSPRTINRHLAVLSKVLQWAYERDHIGGVPKVKQLAEPDAPVFYLSEDDERRLRDRVIERYGPDLALVMDVQIASGCRIGELLRMTPDKVLGPVEGYYTLDLGITKNGKPRHTPIPASLGEPWRALVEKGLPSYPSVHKRLVRARRDVGMPTTQPTHAHRHTTATRLTAKGASTAVVMEYLGHRNVSTTMRYAHVETSSKREASRLLLGSKA